MLGRDGIAALVILGGCAALFALTLGLADNPLVPIGPGFYPRLVLGTTAVLALALLVSERLAVRRARPGAPAAPSPPINRRLVVLTFAIFALYVAALPYLGFRVATVAFVACMQAALARPRGARAWTTLIVTALVTTTVTYFVFEHYLHVLLPRGRWTTF